MCDSTIIWNEATNSQTGEPVGRRTATSSGLLPDEPPPPVVNQRPMPMVPVDINEIFARELNERSNAASTAPGQPADQFVRENIPAGAPIENHKRPTPLIPPSIW